MSRRVLRAQVITTKMFKSISNFVRENRYQDNVQNNVRVHSDAICALSEYTPSQVISIYKYGSHINVNGGWEFELMTTIELKLST